MRIISGKLKGRLIKPNKKFKARPTTDYAKESIFNIINNNFDLEGLKALDLFSGTGSISYEFASRGCSEVISVESNFKHYNFIKKTANDLKLDEIKTIKSDVFTFLQKCRTTFDLIFADPPYDMDGIENIHQLVFENNLLDKDGWLIIEHSKHTEISNLPHFIEQRNYGSVNFSIYCLEK